SVFINQSMGASGYQWSFGDGGLSDVTNPTHLYTAGNTSDEVYTAMLVASNIYGCSDTATAQVTVYHKPVAVALVDSLFGCYPQMVSFHNASVGADTYQWVYGNGLI